jgi:hypothetical protein
LMKECTGLPPGTDVIVSEVVHFVAEARAFVLNGVVAACSLYEGDGNRDHAAKSAERVAMALDLPSTCVIDVGLLPDQRWVLVELNATWGAGLNGCDPEEVVPCIEAAARMAPNEEPGK